MLRIGAGAYRKNRTEAYYKARTGPDHLFSFNDFQLSDIDQQNNFVGSSCLKMRSGVHNGTPYKQFRKDLRLYDSASGDTLNISYSGYLFNRNQSVYSLTTITLSSDFDSIGEVALFGNIYTNISHR